jgi:hypothetical protein
MSLPAHTSESSLNITGSPKCTITSQQAIYIQVIQALHISHFARKQVNQQNLQNTIYLEVYVATSNHNTVTP